jgi:membrane peptidoglycan carboxypeptidase
VSSEEPTFTLGQEPTSALELTGAFAAAANDGVFCPPRPILRVTSASGDRVHLRTEPCRRVFTSYVARTLIQVMRRDTRSGTAASYFHQWYGRGGSPVAGKTGTDNDAADTGNSALWFVGSTPHLVAAAALVDPRNPKETVHGLPGQPAGRVGQDTFGAYASRFWLAAFGPGLRTHWSWPSPSAVGGRRVPRVIGQTAGEAEHALRAAGFRVDVFPVVCASKVPGGRVAYQQPPTAPTGTAVTICLSSGHGPYVQKPPVKHTAPRPAPARPRRPHPAPPRHHGPPGHGHGHGGGPGHRH